MLFKNYIFRYIINKSYKTMATSVGIQSSHMRNVLQDSYAKEGREDILN
jgi:hypothetical protein